MNLTRRVGYTEARNSNGQVAELRHRLDQGLIYVRISPYASCTWVAAECTFRFVPRAQSFENTAK